MQNERERKPKKKLTAEQVLVKKRNAKLRVVVGMFLVMILVLVRNVFVIKAEYGDEYTRKAILQQVTKNGVDTIITPNRGTILDRNKSVQALAISSTVYKVIFDCKVLLKEDKEVQAATIEKMSRILGIPVETLETYLIENPDRNYFRLPGIVSGKTKELFEKENARHVYFLEDTLRKYPSNNVAASLVGFTRADNSNWGIEAKYNDELTGTTGRMFRLYDKDSNPTTEKIDPIKGNTLVTTIDLVLQQEAENLLQKYAEESQAESASLVVMDPNTGEIIVMAEYPTFDLNNPFDIDKITSPQLRAKIEETPEDKRLDEYYKLWRNFCISDSFEPGSIYKPLVVAAALEEGIIGANDTFYCSGGKSVNGTYIKCWHAGHGHLNYIGVLGRSCNVGVMDINEKLGRERYYEYQKSFGIGQMTGIDLIGEANTEYLVHGLANLNPVELAASAMGQGLNATTLQMITALSATVNGGNLMQPYVVSQILDENNKVVADYSPTIQRKVISKETSQLVREAMVTTLEPGGTGAKAAIPGYKIGGKTGTGQQGVKVGDGSEELALSFMTFFPTDDPQYVVLAVIYKPQNYVEGQALTIPMVKDMMSFMIQQKRIPADNLEGDAFIIVDDTEIIQDYVGRGTAETTNNLNYLGYTYDISGSGSIIKTQFPAGGSKVTKGTKVFFTVEPAAEGEVLSLVPNVTGMTKEQAVEALTSVNLIPIIVDSTLQTSTVPQQQAEETPSPSTSADAETVKIVINQLPKYEIRVQPKTEIRVYIE